MNADYLSQITSFTSDNLPDLDLVVLAALEYLSKAPIPKLDIGMYKRPLIIGSVNALSTGRVIFSEVDAVFAEESNYTEALTRVLSIDAVYILSASGGKHAIHIAEEIQKLGLPVFLITSNPNAPAAVFVRPENVFVFPHIREPYTYNTSTYIAMMLGLGEEFPEKILSFIETNVAPAIPNNLEAYHSFILLLPPEFAVLRSMFETKFDELFGSLRLGRAFTIEEIKHAKTVIPSETESFISFGSVNTEYGKDSGRIFIPLPDSCGPIAMLAIGYFVIGNIQKQNPPFFKENIAAYVEHTSQIFKQNVSVIVE